MSEIVTGHYDGPIFEKYLKIDAGLQRLRTGEFSPFMGFPPSLMNRYNLSLLLTPGSIDEYETRVGEPIRQIESATGLRTILAGRDFPLHMTLQEGQLPDDLVQQRQNIFNSLDREPDIQQLTAALTDKDAANWIVGKYVLSDGPALMLTSPHIPPIILDARSSLSQMYQQAGLSPLPMDNILHATLARITAKPVGDSIEPYNEAYLRVMELKRSVSTQPLVLSVDNVYQGPSYNLISGTPSTQ